MTRRRSRLSRDDTHHDKDTRGLDTKRLLCSRGRGHMARILFIMPTQRRRRRGGNASRLRYHSRR